MFFRHITGGRFEYFTIIGRIVGARYCILGFNERFSDDRREMNSKKVLHFSIENRKSRWQHICFAAVDRCRHAEREWVNLVLFHDRRCPWWVGRDWGLLDHRHRSDGWFQTKWTSMVESHDRVREKKTSELAMVKRTSCLDDRDSSITRSRNEFYFLLWSQHPSDRRCLTDVWIEWPSIHSAHVHRVSSSSPWYCRPWVRSFLRHIDPTNRQRLCFCQYRSAKDADSHLKEDLTCRVDPTKCNISTSHASTW